ncbi:MAG: LarC family nickel insertion protein [Lachnospiraceae bacterium]
MNQALYLECNSGISGDMTVAALLDLGADEQVLREALKSLPLTGYTVEISRVKKAGIDCCDFHVRLDTDNHDHDMEYLYGHDHHGGHDHNPGHQHDQRGKHEHHHPHEHRGLKEIETILGAGSLTEGALRLAMKIFRILAEAESKAHGVPMEQVHFHEVGAVDSIVDIAAAAICFDNLGVGKVILPRISEGYGTVRCQHGILSVPVPASSNIMETYGLTIHMTAVKGELITPTGAAIAAAIRTTEELPAEFKIRKIGMGAGKRQYELPGILRAMLIEEMP